MHSIALCHHQPYIPLDQYLLRSNRAFASFCRFVANCVDMMQSAAPASRQKADSVSVPEPVRHQQRTNADGDSVTIAMAGLTVPADITTEVVSHNGYTQTFRNVYQVFLRNLASVGVSTAAREWVKQGVLTPVATSAPTAFTAAAVASGAFPIVLQVVSLANDAYQGRHTERSIAARLACIILTSGAMAGLACSGSLTTATPALVAAVWVYVPVRDFLQYFLQLDDNAPQKTTLPPVAAAAGCYAANQTLISLAMAKVAGTLSPSAASIIAITGLNIVGETIEHFTYRQFVARFSKTDLRLVCRRRAFSEISWKNVTDSLTIPFAARLSLFAATNATTFSIKGGSIIESVTAGLTLGIGYPMFIYSGDFASPDAEQNQK